MVKVQSSYTYLELGSYLLAIPYALGLSIRRVPQSGLELNYTKQAGLWVKNLGHPVCIIVIPCKHAN